MITRDDLNELDRLEDLLAGNDLVPDEATISSLVWLSAKARDCLKQDPTDALALEVRTRVRKLLAIDDPQALAADPPPAFRGFTGSNESRACAIEAIQNGTPPGDPGRAIAWAIVYLGDRVDELSSDDVGTAVERLATEVGSVAQSISDVATEIGGAS